LQKSRLRSTPVAPNKSVDVLTSAGALKPAAEIMATGTLPSDFILIGLVEVPGLMSMTGIRIGWQSTVFFAKSVPAIFTRAKRPLRVLVDFIVIGRLVAKS
jgi:hypothetical protein